MLSLLNRKTNTRLITISYKISQRQLRNKRRDYLPMLTFVFGGLTRELFLELIDEVRTSLGYVWTRTCPQSQTMGFKVRR